MRMVFAGTPDFAAQALDALADAGHEIVGVFTQPDRPAGRGLHLQASAVKQRALARGLPVFQPQGLKLDGKFAVDAHAAREALQTLAPEVMVVAAYGLILPQWVLTLPPLGCLNIHASLLPRWRGAAPIHRAIEAGDAQTGVSIMQMDAGLDTGDVLLTEALDISPQDTTATLHDRLASLGGRLMVQALAQWREPGLSPTPQPAEGVTYAHKIDKRESALDWSQPAEVLERRLRAFDPFPGGTADLGGQTHKVWRGQVLPSVARPAGTWLQLAPDRVGVACASGCLELLELQRPGGKRQAAAVWCQALPAAQRGLLLAP